MLHTFINRRLLSVFLLGFSSGLPLALSGTTLQAWFTVEGVNILHISLLAVLGIPYLYKFLWAPVLDRYDPPLLGRRRGWILLMQLALVFILFLMASFTATSAPRYLALLAFVLAFFSATQDIAIDAYRVEVLRAKERGLGAAYSVAGYRIGMICSGAFAMVIADEFGWRITYLIMSFLMALSLFATVFSVNIPTNNPVPTSMKETVRRAMLSFFSRENAYLLLIFIVLYKLGEAFTSSAGSLVTAFLLRELHFSLTTVGTINKGLGLSVTLLGIFLGGALLTRLSIYRALLCFGLLQAFANLLFLLLAIVGKNLTILIAVVTIDNLCAGLGTAAFISFLMSLCDQKFAASQFAIFTALSAVGRVLLAPAAGSLIEHAGWIVFFIATFLLAFPGLIVLKYLQSTKSLPQLSESFNSTTLSEVA